MNEPPSLGEVLRRLNDIRDDIRESRTHADVTYARRETVAEQLRNVEIQRVADRQDLEEVKRSLADTAAFRRVMWLGFGTAVLTSLVAVVLTIVTLLAG